MANQSTFLEIVIQAKDEASKVIQSMSGTFKNLVDDAKVGSGIIVGSLALVSRSVVQIGADMESARTSFTTFLGSGEKAGKLLKDLSDFAVKTPFDLPQVVDGTKRLLAYGIAADNVIPVFKNLGDLSSGNKVKLDQLILAYGQVRAATKLTGAELRQFTEAGIPLLDALANEMNKNGGALVSVGKASKTTAGDVKELNDDLNIAKLRLDEATKSGKAKASTMASLKNTVENYTEKIAKANGEMASSSTRMVRMKVTAAQVRDMISDGSVSFDMMNKALQGLNSEGGMFFNNMSDQSRTFGGVMSNLRDEFSRFAINVLGFTETGEIREGSIFYYLKIGAEKALIAVQQIRPIVQQFVDSLLNNQQAIFAFFGGLIGLMIPLAVAMWGVMAPALALMAIGAAIGFLWQPVFELLKRLAEELRNAWVNDFDNIRTNVENFTSWFDGNVKPILVAWFKVITDGVKGLADAYGADFQNMKQNTEEFINFFRDHFFIPFKKFKEELVKMIAEITPPWVENLNRIKGGFDGIASAIGTVIGKIDELVRMGTGKGLGSILAQKILSSGFASGLPFAHGGFVPGPSNQAVPATLHGGERVIPKLGTDVNPGSGSGLTINFNGSVNMDSQQRVEDLANLVISMLGRQNELAAKGVAV